MQKANSTKWSSHLFSPKQNISKKGWSEKYGRRLWVHPAIHQRRLNKGTGHRSKHLASRDVGVPQKNVSKGGKPVDGEG